MTNSKESLIEKVARAIESLETEGDFNAYKEKYMNMAKAAIAAMGNRPEVEPQGRPLLSSGSIPDFPAHLLIETLKSPEELLEDLSDAIAVLRAKISMGDASFRKDEHCAETGSQTEPAKGVTSPANSKPVEIDTFGKSSEISLDKTLIAELGELITLKHHAGVYLENGKNLNTRNIPKDAAYAIAETAFRFFIQTQEHGPLSGDEFEIKETIRKSVSLVCNTNQAAVKGMIDMIWIKISPYLRTPKPVSVSLTACADVLEKLSHHKTMVTEGGCPTCIKQTKAILDAAGVKYV